MAKLEQVEQGLSNIQSTPPINLFTEEDSGFQSKSYFLTYHLDDFEHFESVFKSIKINLVPLCEDYIFGEEYGKSGKTRHIQGAFTLKNKTRATTIDKLCFAHGSTLRKLKSWDAAFVYCQKEGNNILTNHRIKRPKLFLSEVDLNAWELKICSLIDNEIPNDRDIHWFWSRKGNIGKTTFSKFLCNKYVEHGVTLIGGKAADSKNGIATFIDKSFDKRAPEIIILPVPRSYSSEYLSYEAIECIKDMFFYSGKYEGSVVNDNSPWIFVFSNKPPNRSKCSPDR